MTVERRTRVEPDIADPERGRARVVRDPEVLARAQAAAEAFRRRELPEGDGIGPEELPGFLRDHG